MLFRFLSISFALLFTLSACQTTDDKRLDSRATGERKSELKIAKPLQQEVHISQLNKLTKNGINYLGSFDSTGSQLVYVGRMHSEHRHSQIYLMDLISGKSRRLSYSVGQTWNVLFHPTRNELFYSSSTDEVKENPDLNRLMGDADKVDDSLEASIVDQSQWPGLEVYGRTLQANSFRRLTDKPGFDVIESIDSKAQKLLFSHFRAGTTSLVLTDTHLRPIRELHRQTGPHLYHARISPKTSQLIWVESKDNGIRSIVIVDEKNKNKKTILSTSKIIRDLSWSSDESRIYFVSTLADEKNWDVYSVRIENGCVQRITYDQGRDFYPVAHPDGQQLLFSSERDGDLQLYLARLSSESMQAPDCIPNMAQLN